jgi:hypothetical protein
MLQDETSRWRWHGWRTTTRSSDWRSIGHIRLLIATLQTSNITCQNSQWFAVSHHNIESLHLNLWAKPWCVLWNVRSARDQTSQWDNGLTGSQSNGSHYAIPFKLVTFPKGRGTALRSSDEHRPWALSPTICHCWFVSPMRALYCQRWEWWRTRQAQSGRSWVGRHNSV